MRILDLIHAKRNDEEHTAAEIEWIVNAYTKGEIPDYQMSAWLMAVYFRGMSEAETAAMTMAMVKSGEILDLSGIPGIKADKHSTGGVADTTTLILAPLVAATGVPVAKMSGRGLGFTGGTIDKLEAIPGFNVTLDRATFIGNVAKHGLAIMAQSLNLTPADGQIYSLRDVTGTVESIPLIASSIMSKKIAAGADKIVLDVKVGAGAFMKRYEDALSLARLMVEIGRIVNRETVAVLTNMEQPLGMAVGNSLEVEEAIDILSGQGCPELRDVCLALGAHMLRLAGRVRELEEGREMLQTVLASGAALAKFAEFIQAQNGNPEIITRRELLPRAKLSAVITSQEAGFVTAIDPARIGYAAVLLGAGRLYKNQPLDLSAGIVLTRRVGDAARPGDPLAKLFFNDASQLEEARRFVASAFSIDDRRPPKKPLILGVVEHESK
ncbi:MAG: pyrimidine-nucleoside phosphorylase [Negativicutes bacterium]|nr:pyrimidine-nucleoside phosphorylase [Negativicutes bacterium]